MQQSRRLLKTLFASRNLGLAAAASEHLEPADGSCEVQCECQWIPVYTARNVQSAGRVPFSSSGGRSSGRAFEITVKCCPGPAAAPDPKAAVFVFDNLKRPRCGATAGACQRPCCCQWTFRANLKHGPATWVKTQRGRLGARPGTVMIQLMKLPDLTCTVQCAH
jgi:hypothetical protein